MSVHILFDQPGKDGTDPIDAAATPYEVLRQRHMQDMRVAFPAAMERLGWSARQLEAERTQRLRKLLRIAKEQSAWHRGRLQHIDPDTFTEAQLQDIAPMTRAHLMDHFDEIVTDPRLTLAAANAHLDALQSDAYLLDRYHVSASSATGGRRGVMVHDWEGWADGSSGFARHLVRLSRSVAPGRPIVGAVIGSQNPMHVSSAMPQTFSDASSANWHRFPVTLPFDAIIDGLKRTQPIVLMSYPTMLRELALAAQSGSLEVSPLAIVSTAEPLLPEIRDAVAAAWPQSRLLNFWGMTEAFPGAFSCGVGHGMHLSDDLLIVEAVDAEGRPVAPGTRSTKIFVTNLYNATPLPIIRYEVTDEVTFIAEPCACGSAHRRIEDVLGRLDDVFAYSDAVAVHPSIFRRYLSYLPQVLEYQVTQTPQGAAIAIRCESDVDVVGLSDSMAEDLQRLGVANASVEISRVEHIERPRSGKFKRFVPLPARS